MAAARALRHLMASSRPAATAPRSVVSAHRRVVSTSTEAGGAGDPEVHSGGPLSDDYADRAPKFSGSEEGTGGAGQQHDKHPSPPPRPPASTKESVVPPFAPSGKKLGSQELADGTTGGPSFTQRRRWSAPGRDSRDDATPGREEAAARKVREEDREYYRTHKPSPIAEVEFADTRKPITRATDGGSAAERFADAAPATVVKDTVDDSLARAEAMFREAASRGNPAWPHSRALAEMLARRREEAAGAGGGGAPWSN